MMASPDTSGSLDDPGDDTARRFQYQWTYAAIMCCQLLDGSEDVAEIFCEHHEDILQKHTDGTFSGLQLKTRDADQDVWRTSDPALLSSFATFAKLEAAFPGQFRRFLFLTNYPLHSGKNGKDICHVLATIQAAAAHAELPSSVLAFLSKVAKKAGCSEDIALSALKKSSASADLPGRADVEARLFTTLTPVWTKATECSHASLQRAAKALVTECGRASSLAHEGLLPAYVPLSVNDGKMAADAITFKRMTKERVLQTLEEGFAATASLDGDTSTMSVGSSGSPALLKAKLDAGGFSATSLNSATDLRDRADYLAMVWTKKHGEPRGLQRQQNIRTVVLRDAADAFEASRRDGSKFGVHMLNEFRKRLQIRRQQAGQQLHDCSNEHLEGFAYGLTSECQIEWSLERPWERNDEHR
jgi:hypothetical protein